MSNGLSSVQIDIRPLLIHHPASFRCDVVGEKRKDLASLSIPQRIYNVVALPLRGDDPVQPQAGKVLRGETLPQAQTLAQVHDIMWCAIETPIAVMSGAKRKDDRNGR